ncbi:stress response RCI peptide protein, putative [Rhizoctonia solani AG-3 Rhs1AP]|uniref:Stress response RCI peptide protein, putative n=2 Tax=Rhizoctonia solani AG-3 TaxID=1086053 RepID=X8JN11_9AGAM|nr:stress response RCI peptide protein, putative [Rhizoctonia solani AG-3 Rhs1AP]KEP53398.1 putative stress response RCI peptide protein [Rhizoctonia solani 123E]
MSRPPSSTSDVLLYFIALLVPPIPVFIKRGCSADVLINILLWVLGWIPGVIHAWSVNIPLVVFAKTNPSILTQVDYLQKRRAATRVLEPYCPPVSISS